MAESLVKLRDVGIHKMEHKKWSKADSIFTKVIDKVTISSDEDALLKCSSLLQRSLCRMFLEKRDDALSDANAVIDIYRQVRPEDKISNGNISELEKDPMTPILSLAYLRRGQISELNGKLLAALQEYSRSSALYPNSEGQAALSRLLEEVGLPFISKEDADLAVFSAIPISILNIEKLSVSLSNAIKFLTENEVTQEQILKINSSGCCRIFYSILQIYIDFEPIVSSCLHILTVLASKGASDVWAGYVIIHHVLSKWKDNETIFTQILNILQLAPKDLFERLMEYNFVELLCDGFKYDLNEVALQTLFYLIFQIANNEELLVKANEKGIVEICMQKKTSGAMMLLSKICIIKDALKKAINGGALDWSFELLETKDLEIQLYRASMIVITRYFLTIPLPEEGKEVEKRVKELSERVFDDINPIILSSTKVPELVSCAFGTISLCVPYAPSKVEQYKLIRLASVLLSIYLKEPQIASNIVSFIFECSNYGYLNAIKNDRAVMPTVMKALSVNPKEEMLVERAVILANLCDHQNKTALLQAALLQFPTSKLLKDFITKNGTSLLK
ncbi:hypothetical protein GPJ56_010269 [Histomonas meleagridis]|uniref:uncharacterized protein n=1 Tax=Histomonas meleagridis TaxID=135588 RepID=UPI003559A164|nr:hypothetical protein GPJ56_010269 [Histomonas meleagridis]KAH0797138.1 hypothetical protein GO595_011031 [Histomonas meleagridis]